MAYKFQRGPAVLSGSITAEDGLNAGSSGLAAAGAVAGATTIAASSLANLNGGIEVDNGGNKFTVSTAGVVVAAGKITGDEFATDGDEFVVSTAGAITAPSLKHDSLVIGRATGNDDITFSDDTIDLMTANTSRLKVETANTTVSNNLIVAGNLTVQGSSVEIQQGFVVTSSVQFEGATPDGNEISLTSADPSADRTITLPDLTGHVPLIAGAIGNANVTSAEFLLLDGGSSIGTTAVSDGHGILMNHGGTMAQTTVQTLAAYLDDEITAMPNLVEVGALAAGSIASGFTKINVADVIDVGSLDIDGASDIGAALEDADLIIVDDGANGTERKCAMSRVKTYIEDNATINSATAQSLRLNGAGTIVSTNQAISNDAVLLAATASSLTLQMPNITTNTIGKVYVIKDIAGNAATNPTTINKSAGNHDMDGNDSIVIESNFGAVNLLACSSSAGGFFYAIF